MVGLADLEKLLSERKKIEGICHHLKGLYKTKVEGAFSCENKKSNWWCCDDHYERMSYEDAVDTLIEHAESVIKKVEKQSDNVIEEFTVGKTHVDINLTSDYFKPEQPRTWGKNHVAINRRWKAYKKSGYHCLIVMCCITKDITEGRKNEENEKFPMHQEQYALAMEQRLIHYFRLTKNDSRLGNKSFATGKVREKPTRGGIVYVAFKFKEDGTNGPQTPDKLPNDTSSSGLQNNRTATTEGQDKKRKKKPKKDGTNGPQTPDKLPNDTSSSGLQNNRTAKTEGQDKKRKKKPKKVCKSKSKSEALGEKTSYAMRKLYGNFAET